MRVTTPLVRLITTGLRFATSCIRLIHTSVRFPTTRICLIPTSMHLASSCVRLIVVTLNIELSLTQLLILRDHRLVTRSFVGVGEFLTHKTHLNALPYYCYTALLFTVCFI